MNGSADYLRSWERRILSNAPKDETVDDVLRLMERERYMNRGRWAAYVVRLGAANDRYCKWCERKVVGPTKNDVDEGESK